MMDDKTKTQKKDNEKEKQRLIDQIRNEYDLAYKHQAAKIDKWLATLKLYNNQRRSESSVGDPLLFTIHQTVLAALYNDTLISEFSGNNYGDEEKAENLQYLAEYDYVAMEKSITDYYWDWDASFFGRGLLGMSEFHRDPEKNIFLPIQEVFDPITFLHDPYATSVNGNKLGHGGMRFGGRPLYVTKRELKERGFFKNIDKIEKARDVHSLLVKASDMRSDASGHDSIKNKQADLGENEQFEILEWYTHFNGKKVKVYLANDRTMLISEPIAELKNKWSIIDRTIYPMSNSWDSVSIPDLVEDKQRARAIAQNLGLDMMKADMYPMYVYNSKVITNRNNLNFEFNKFIPSDGSVRDALAPISKASPNFGLLNFIFNALDTAAQKATATPEIQQGALSSQQRTLGELNLISSNVDTRYSLASKIFGWSEKRFWQRWYQMYKEYYDKDIDEKVIRITGALGNKWRKLTKDNFVMDIDPDVKITSKTLKEVKNQQLKQSLSNYAMILLQEQSSDKRWILRYLGKLNGLSGEETKLALPLSSEEINAKEENKLLNDNKFVPVFKNQDHETHYKMHLMAADTKATFTHIKAHVEAMRLKREMPEMFDQQGQPTDQQLGQPEQNAQSGQQQPNNFNLPAKGVNLIPGAGQNNAGQ